MNYPQYFEIARDKWKQENRGVFPPKLENFYNDPARPIPVNTFGLDYAAAVNSISEKVFNFFSNNKREGIMLEYPDIWKSVGEDLKTISNYIVPHLERYCQGSESGDRRMCEISLFVTSRPQSILLFITV